MAARRRRYDLAFKSQAVVDAERTSIKQAAEAHDVPERTLGYWYEHAEFAELRAKTRDELAAGSIVLAVVAQGELVKRIQAGTLNDQSLVAAYGVAIDKAQLLSGGATQRSENRDITGTLSDLDVLDALRAAEQIATGGGAPQEAEDTPEG